MITLLVNGERHQLDADGEMPLLWALRDVLALQGTKFGCGKGLCGSCTVIVNGKSVRSCVTPVSQTVGQAITTIEGLSVDGSHPVQAAWAELNVPQCGYCQSGQIMSAVALLERNPSPSDQEIQSAMQGNLCRCGTYQRILAAVRRASQAAVGGGS